MKYGITKLNVSEKVFIDIDCDKFYEIINAREAIFEIMNIEEKINLVIENYSEFEKQLIEDTLEEAIFFNIKWTSIVDRIHTINRRLVNFLSSCRLYLDQISHNISSLYDSDKIDLVNDKKSEEYDSNLSYRVMESLRNYVQHRNLPVHNLSLNRKQVEEIDERMVKHIITPKMDISRLKEDKKFKRSVLKELDEYGELVDIKPFVRKYMRSLGSIHKFVRKLFYEDYEIWKNTFNEVIRKYNNESKSKEKSVTVIEIDDSGNVNQEVRLFVDVIKRLEQLMNKNQFLEHYDSYLITSETYE